MTTTESNKLIAEFMGAEFDMGHYYVTDSYKKADGEDVFKYQQGTAYWNEGEEPTSIKGGYPINILKYHTSWNWLMPVVEKIESLGFEVSIHSRTCQAYKPGLFQTFGEDGITKIQAVYQAVIQFIQWYNTQSK